MFVSCLCEFECFGIEDVVLVVEDEGVDVVVWVLVLCYVGDEVGYLVLVCVCGYDVL